jgi:hypothetical protein
MRKLSKFILFLVLSITLTFGGLFSSLTLSQAATTANVSATVTAQLISVTVASGTVAYGTVVLSGTKDTTASGLNNTQTATNNGNVAEDFSISSSNATGGTQWTISGTAIGSDQYMHKFSVNGGSTWAAMTTSNTSLASNIAATSGTRTFDLQILTPSSSTDYTQKTITVTVLAAAH